MASSVERQAFRTVNVNGKGRPYENMMAEAMGAYCIKKGIAAKSVVGTQEDEYWGTDFKVYGELDTVTGNSGILRLDFTTAFSEKDNMPLIWTPQTEIEQLKGHPLKFGIRTGNTKEGFNYPVVVIGIDASGNEDPDDDVDIELVMAALQSNTAKHAGAILYEAGMAMAEYTYRTKPEYVTWCETEEGQESGIVPDGCSLSPNFDGLGNLHTYKKSWETVSGLKLAKELAAEYVLDNDQGTPEFEQARDFMRACDRKLAAQPRTPKQDGPWMQQLQQALKASKEYEKRPDGLSK